MDKELIDGLSNEQIENIRKNSLKLNLYTKLRSIITEFIEENKVYQDNNCREEDDKALLDKLILDTLTEIVNHDMLETGWSLNHFIDNEDYKVTELLYGDITYYFRERFENCYGSIPLKLVAVTIEEFDIKTLIAGEILIEFDKILSKINVVNDSMKIREFTKKYSDIIRDSI